MNLIKRQSYFPSIFDEFFSDNWDIKMMNDKYISPSHNVKENEKEFVIEIAIPGKNNTDFNIEIENRSLLISTNNYITFDLTDANAYSPWNTYAIPSAAPPGEVINAIMGPWMDLNPNNGVVFITMYTALLLTGDL